MSRSVLAVTLAGVLAAGLAGGAGTAQAGASAREDGASGIGDPYWPLDGNGGIDVASYRIHNRYALATKRLAGRTAVGSPPLPTCPASPSTSSSRSARSPSTVPRPRFTRSGGGHELRITPSRPLPSGSTHTAVVTYAGNPAKQGYAGERNWLASTREVVTMNEPHMAAWWFPANDHPLDKAIVDVRITVPKGREVVSNGKLRGRRTTRRGTTWHWRADEPMVPYLAFFAAGDFTMATGRRDGLPWLVAVSDRLSPAQQRRSMRLMKISPAVVAELEKDLGDYPFSIVGGLTTSLNPGFALENQTRPTYPALGYHYTSLVVHELAHQWFGDDIAVQGWRDIWLNEGFASFMEWRWEETHGLSTAAEILRRAYDDTDAGSSFWAITVADPGAAHIFDGAVYDRGAMTLQALRNRVGEPVFWSIIRTWIDEQSGGNGSTEEFEETAERVSGQELTSFFTAWLRTPEKPARTADNGLG